MMNVSVIPATLSPAPWGRPFLDSFLGFSLEFWFLVALVYITGAIRIQSSRIQLYFAGRELFKPMKAYD